MSASEPEVMQPQDDETSKKKGRQIARRDTTAIAQERPVPGSIEDLMVRAVEQGNMDVIERVFALSKEVKAERAKEAFLDAMSKFQSFMPKILKNKKGYGYWYAPLGEIEDKIQKPMELSGLSKRWKQVETQSPDTVTMICIVSHRDGHSEETPIGPVGWDLLERTDRMNGLQHRSAVITYLQRYTLIGGLGLSSAESDPDGVIPEEARAQKGAQQQRQPVSQPQQKPTAKRAADAKAAALGEKPQIQPASEGEAIEASTIKVLTAKMESGALSGADFEKRFGFKGIERVNRKDINVVLSWIADPTR